MSHEDMPLAAASTPAHRGVRHPSPASVSGMSPQPFFGGNTSINQISGKITSGEDIMARVYGHWVRGCPRAGTGRPRGQCL